MLERLNRSDEALDLLTRLITADEAKGRSVTNYWLMASAKAGLLERMTRTNDAVAFLTQLVTKADAEGDSATNIVKWVLLSRSALLRRMNRATDAQADWLRASRIPARNPRAKANLIDLSPWYNTALAENWHTGEAGHSVTNLPPGIRSFQGIDFDVRGAIHLSGIQLARYRGDYPPRVDGLRIGGKLARFHVLHAAACTVPDGTEIGQFILHYADGQERKIPIQYGQDVRDWWFTPDDSVQTPQPAWTGSNAVATQRGAALRLYVSSWDNPRPEAQLATLDYVSAMTDSAPFLIAITVVP
jgi:hypothetical protein